MSNYSKKVIIYPEVNTTRAIIALDNFIVEYNDRIGFTHGVPYGFGSEDDALEFIYVYQTATSYIIRQG